MVANTLDQVLTATSFADLFPEGTKKELRNWLKFTHPDLHSGEEEKAQQAFVHVNAIWRLKGTSAKLNEDPTAPAADTLHTKKNTYANLRQQRSNGGVITYSAETEGELVSLLISTHEKVSTFLQDGIKNLKDIKSIIPELYREFFPTTVDAFQTPQGGKKLFGVAQTLPKGFYTLTEVLEDYPEGIAGEDVAWMLRRMLVAVGNTHDAGYAHGGLSTDAFLIEPETHDLIITNWQYSVELGESVRMTNLQSAPWYGAEDSLVIEGKTIQAGPVDNMTTIKKELQQIAMIGLELGQKNLPPRIKQVLVAFLRYTPDTAGEMMNDFDFVLKEQYGARKFHHFKMRRA